MANNEKPITEQPNPVEVTPVAAPSIYANTINITAGGNDFSLVFAKTHPAITAGRFSGNAVLVPAAVVSVSPQTAKDLYLLLQEIIPQYEKQFGQIKTLFSEQKKVK